MAVSAKRRSLGSERAQAVVADLSTGSSHVLNELRAASAQTRQGDGPPQPRVAVVIERTEDLPEVLPPNVQVITRPPTALFEGEPTLTTQFLNADVEATWLDDLAQWFRSVAISMTLEEEAERLLNQGVYRSAVVAGVSAFEVALREVLEAHDPLPSIGRPSSKKRAASPFNVLLDEAAAANLINSEELRDLRETQRVRNALIHSDEGIDGRRARPMVERTLAISTRLRASYL